MSLLVRFVLVFHFVTDAGDVIRRWPEMSPAMAWLNLIANLMMALLFVLKLEDVPLRFAE
jgi:hypothetical protein